MVLIVHFVDDEQNGSAALSYPASGLGVFFHGSRCRVDDEENEIGTRERGLGLLGDLVFERAARLEPTSGVHDLKGHAAPLDFNGFSIARDAALLFDDGNTLSGEAIHQ